MCVLAGRREGSMGVSPRHMAKKWLIKFNVWQADSWYGFARDVQELIYQQYDWASYVPACVPAATAGS